ncbi:MAG: carbamoyl-phosphate synthase large subunit, partial [Actinomycetota bacterium]|nr:carbamoyl-phosphate synthase large subunit [Actinomycetota bacterium]
MSSAVSPSNTGISDHAPTLVVANRGEIAVRVIRAAQSLSWRTVALHTPDDVSGRALSLADHTVALPTPGVAGYLDIDAVVAAAVEVGADAIHPGYGFLAERADFARRCEAEGITFVGPTADCLELFGDKVAARHAAEAAGLSVLAGSTGPATLAEAEALLERHGAIMLKAVAGGGGRGMRAVRHLDELGAAWERCVSEAEKSFGSPDVYVEQLVDVARHIEVQIVGDGTGEVVHLGERDCSVQRRNQKLVEIAPAPSLPVGLRSAICAAAVRLGASVSYANVGTVEFLLDAAAPLADDTPFWFIECNPRIQVEHTVTEQTTGVDLVQAQLRLARGAVLAELGLAHSITPQGWAIQARVNAETVNSDGQTLPATGAITVFDLAAGPGVRIDTACYAGATVDASYDSLLAKLIVHRPGGTFEEAATFLYRALCESRIDGVDNNLDLLRGIVRHPGLEGSSTAFFERHLAEFLEGEPHPVRQAPAPTIPTDAGRPRPAANIGVTIELAGGHYLVSTPLQGTVVSVEVAHGDTVGRGQLVAVIEAMKMEHEVFAEAGGVIAAIHAAPGDILWADQPVATISASGAVDESRSEEEAIDLDEIRPGLAEVLALRARMLD